MNLRMTLPIVLLTMTALLPGCLESEARKPMSPDNDGYWAGKTCELENYMSCGDSLQCTAVIESGDIIDAVCLLRQGHVCNPNGPSMCARGQVCRLASELSFQQPTTLAEEPVETQPVYRCLPNTCIDDSECPEGQGCENNQCIGPGSCLS
jgi:hypothetical protein